MCTIVVLLLCEKGERVQRDVALVAADALGKVGHSNASFDGNVRREAPAHVELD